MHTLILLRHAKAEPEADSGLDFDRALTDGGWAEARLIGRVLKDAGFQPDLALVSSATRTVQTWEAASASFPSARAEALDSLYEAGPDQILAEAAKAKADVVVAVGHNPGIATLAAYLARQAGAAEASRMERAFPTAAAAAFRHDGRRVTGFEGYFPPAGPSG